MADSDWSWQTPVGSLLRQLACEADPKRLQQFACACCRRVEHLLGDERSRHALQVAHRFAAGQATDDELRAAHQTADFINHGTAHDEYAMAEPHAIAAYAAYLATKVQSVEDAAYVANECDSALSNEDDEWLEDEPPPPTPEVEWQCQLARTMFGPRAEGDIAEPGAAADGGVM